MYWELPFRCKIPSINYYKAEKNELKKWEIRYLTNYSFKSSSNTKLNNSFIFLPNPNPSFTRALNDICYKFIWDQKPDKINIKQLCTSNLELTSAPWVQLAKHIVGDINKIVLFGSGWAFHIGKQIDNHFWKDVPSAWACVLQNIHQKCNIYKKLFVPLWYNPEITQATLYIPELYKRILYPIDLTINGEIMTRENIALHYNVSIDFLTYHRLYLCLKKHIGLTILNPNS